MVEKMYRLLVVAITLILLFFAKPVISFAKELNQDMYPYRACFRGTVQRIREDKSERSWLTTLRVNEVYLKDEFFSAHKSDDPDRALRPLFYSSLEPNHTYEFRTWSIEDVFGMPSKNAIGKEFLWSMNPDKIRNEIRSESNPEILLFSKVSRSKLDTIKKQIAGTAQKWAATKSYLQSEIEKQWSPSRIREILKHPDARLNPSLQSHTGPRVLSGILYREQQKELGKVSWAAIFYSPHQYDGIDLMVVKGKDCWRLYPNEIGISAPSKDQELSDLLLIIGHNAFRNYPIANNSNSSSVLSPPEKCKITHKNDGIVFVEYKLGNGGILTMNMDPKFQMSNISLNGKPNQLWSKVFAERFKNMDKMLHEWE